MLTWASSRQLMGHRGAPSSIPGRKYRRTSLLYVQAGIAVALLRQMEDLMKCLLVSVAFAAIVAASPAQADDFSPTAMVGLAFDFGKGVDSGSVGITAKVLSTNREDHFAVGGGLTFFPWADEKLGADISAGYNFKDFGAYAGFDFLRMMPQVSAGFVPTKHKKDAPINVSDARSKWDIRHLVTLPNGIRLYAFKYLWSQIAHVGVMAQELLTMPAYRDAVVVTTRGTYTVNYDALGLRMATLAEWRELGPRAVLKRGIYAG